MLNSQRITLSYLTKKIGADREAEKQKLLDWLHSLGTITWHRVYMRMKKLGYNIRSAQDAQAAIERNPLVLNNEDWKTTIEEFSAKNKKERPKDPFAKAKRFYGLTNNVLGAGYLLPDGKFLDFSEVKEGGLPDERSIDHRNIMYFLDDKYEDKFDAMRDTGMIRLLPESGGFDVYKKPTPAQEKSLLKYISQTHSPRGMRDVTIDHNGKITPLEFKDKTAPSLIVSAVLKYFQ